MIRIDTHHHFFPPGYAEKIGDEAIAGFLVSGRVPQWDASRSLEVLDRNGIATALLSLSSPAVSPVHSASRAKLARSCNEYAATLNRDHPGRFGSLATLPLPDIDQSLEEIQYASRDLQCDGFCLLSNYQGRYLGDACFAPIFEELDRHASVVFVHPTMPEPQPFSVNLPAASIEFPFDTTRAVASLLFSGTFVRYSNVRFVFAHAGGTIPLLSARLARLESQARFRDAVPGGVLASLKALYFDTALSVDPYTAAALLRFASPSRIVFGSDFPHAGTQIVDTALSDLRAAVPDLDVLEAIEHINARALLDKRSG
ncbi:MULTISPECIES: amidohydrolase family protein [Bradyrhizobium]|uniref:amidohydrolase family protein n=1 Tax=Bradyrhizobium TaxID=374 RepID=UPI000231C4A9|nr:amidohydrolase family protein [Bradyrhizobium japonicum]AJA60705.1 hypothetical protein RN69_10140 [Bradyrhizobium japonicum]MCS3534356.1 putative TIM-barrel fold metal-dependent hydrolase [Bradyrhizobium japonicum]MCS3989548.1 putative TIM-barrel fold metal-dependent hydrolase [Bradyrhizobium japonicum]MCS4015636.1 putative TIM-barrel fold metal-dependent hydrolase [Bradyrhizobium japonicum]MCS4202732.1 putative TIM-barrel fold metal-dependent hydrolase [Bradyrhizobium japonicum]